jgi:hypothetical protein
MKASPITIKRFDPKTGEVQGEAEQVDADHFKPKLPKPPVLREPRPSPCRAGQAALHMHDHREEVIAYWEAHASILTKEERSNFANGRSTSSLRPIKPEWQEGDCIEVTTNVTAEVLEVVESFRGWGTVFKVSDFRPWYMKQIVGGSRRPKTDEDGFAAPVNKAEEEAARVDGNYTRSRHLAVPDSEDGDVMDSKLHQRLHAEASMKIAMQGAKRRKRATLLSIETRIAEARKKYRSGEVRYLEREKKSLERKAEKQAA